MHTKPALYCFTKYTEAGPSSRYRTYQYLQLLEQEFEVHIQAGFGNWYLDTGRSRAFKLWRLILAFANRWYFILRLPSNCIVWIEYELFPYMPALAEWYLTIRKIPYSVDYDDAIFHNYDKSGNWLIRKLLHNKIPWVMKHAHTVVTGSPYLTQFAEEHNTNTIEIPTSVDVEKYFENRAQLPGKHNDNFIVGWLGSKSTSCNVAIIKDAMAEFAKHSNAELWVMGFDTSIAGLLTALPVKYFKWEADKEIPFLNTIDVGIMPLYDNPFNRGKCGFKLIQYMAAGKPTISTPMEANIKINRDRNNLFAKNSNEWLTALVYFESNTNVRIGTGIENRNIIELYYAKEINAKQLVRLFLSMTRSSKADMCYT